jgi:hypothetical protein
MGSSIARFSPTNYNMNELEILSNAFEDIFYKFGREYKRVEYIKVKLEEMKFFEKRDYKNFKENVEISETEFEEMLDDSTPILERNHLTFLQDYKVCDFFLYHMHDGELIPVIEIDFFSEAEREQFIRPFWFGSEVSEDRFSSKALFEKISQVEEIEEVE